MTHRLNYSSQALESMHILGEMPWISDEEHAVATVKSVRDTMVLLNKAEKFILPEWGRIFNDEEWALVQDVKYPTRLPYPVIALEYPCTYTMGYSQLIKDREVPSSKRICLAAETEALAALCPHILGPIAEHNPHPEKDGFYIFPVCYSDPANVWTPPPAAMFFPRSGNAGLHMMESRMGHIVVLPLGTDAYQYYPENERDSRAMRDVADEALALCHLMVALSLDKGHHETLPAPEKLNRKRAKRKKPPLFEYKVLDIVADVMNPPKEVTYGREGHHHASPRMHTRRGHVRKLASGKATWVRNAIVGKPKRGEILKQYAVHDKTLH